MFDYEVDICKLQDVYGIDFELYLQLITNKRGSTITKGQYCYRLTRTDWVYRIWEPLFKVRGWSPQKYYDGSGSKASNMTLSLLQKLEALGFQNFFTYRIGPCFQCEETIQTFYNIELRRWYCEKCWYDTDFITELQLSEFGKTMAQVSYEQILARLNAVEAENRKLKASREDNVFVGTTDNLTLK
ncbi:MAG: hypothetical protein E6K87_08090, partial [Thaumarchaeota archaeon]